MPLTVEQETKSKSGTWIELDQSRLYNNLTALRQQQSKSTKVMAIIKANAYGHGLIPIAKSLADHVQYLGVTTVREMLELRANGILTPVLILSKLFENEVSEALHSNVALSVSSLEEAECISKFSCEIKKCTKIHIKVDTGMGRLGIPFSKALNDIEKISKFDSLDLEGLFTHFPSAEKSDGITERQIRDFALLLQALETKDIKFPIRHAANSAGTLKVASPIFNMVRPGLMLYGTYPSAVLKDFAEIEPVLSLKSRFLFIKRLQPGQSVGYGQDFIVKDPCTIGILPIGYSHGYPFKAGKQGHVLFRGKKIFFAGRISMDYIAVNLGNIHSHVGEEVTLIGEEGDQKITLENIAEWGETISYEIATGLSPYIPRYIK